MIQKIVALTQYCSTIYISRIDVEIFIKNLKSQHYLISAWKPTCQKNSLAAEFKTFALSRKKWTRNVSHLNVPFKAK